MVYGLLNMHRSFSPSLPTNKTNRINHLIKITRRLQIDLKVRFNFIHVYVCMYLNVCLGIHGDQKRKLDALELELLRVLSCLTWLLGTKLGSFARTASVLYH